MRSSVIHGALLADEEVGALFADRSSIGLMVDIEVALARVQARIGLIPAEAAERIAGAAPSFEPDLERLASSMALNGVPTIELIRQLRDHVGPDAAAFVHWGATSQDIMDTALILTLRKALGILEDRLGRVTVGLAGLAERHRDTVMVGRTRFQAALPTTFGLKVATWLAPLVRHRERLEQLRPRLLVAQLGGGAGTLAALGPHGEAVRSGLSEELGLGVSDLPWHTQRDALGELASWLSLVTGGLGNMAVDVALMAQTEVGELSESADPDAGTSSTMPHKANPVRSEAILAAAALNASLLSAVHGALIHTHERGGPAWQLETIALPQMVRAAAGALANAVHLTAHMKVDPERMLANVDATRGVLMAEAASLTLSPHLGAADAKAAVRAAAETARTTGRHLIDLLEESRAEPVDWSALRDEGKYLGGAGGWVDAVIERARR